MIYDILEKTGEACRKHLNTAVRLEEDFRPNYDSCNLRHLSAINSKAVLKEPTETADGYGITAVLDERLEIREEFTGKGPVFLQRNTVKNGTDKPQTLTYISSARFTVDTSGVMDWKDDRRFAVYTCRNSWCGEGQWVESTLSQLGIREVKSSYGASRAFTLRSEGNWSTARDFPLLILWDKEKNISYFIEHFGACNWEIELSRSREEETLILDCNSADLHHDGFHHVLLPGETYRTTPALFGKVSGGFEEAVAARIAFLRTFGRRFENGAPVIYNTFMNSIFGSPTAENLMKLIPAAQKAGCEIFCIDAGWFVRDGNNIGLGDYFPSDDRFAPYGFDGIIGEISKAGMVPGVWFEWEALGRFAELAKLPDSLVTRNGCKVSSWRGFAEMRNPQVREALYRAVDRVYRAGVRYIKNDFNASLGIGCGDSADRYGEELRAYSEAFYEFVEELYRRYPDLIIENCGSGGGREDSETLSHFFVQSTSDQELMTNNPSVLSGSLALMPPEKAGNWAYPMPALIEWYQEAEKPERLAEMRRVAADGEQTVLTMTGGILGAMFLSGRIDLADSYNARLIRQGISVYKRIRKAVAAGSPVYPLGFFPLGKTGMYAYGIRSGRKLYLAVTKVNAPGSSVVQIPLRGAKSAKMIYGPAEGSAFALAGEVLTVRLDAADAARLFEITL